MKLNLLKAKLSEKGKSQTQIMKILGLKYTATNLRFNGHIKFRPKEIAKIKDFLELTNDEVVEIFLS